MLTPWRLAVGLQEPAVHSYPNLHWQQQLCLLAQPKVSSRVICSCLVGWSVCVEQQPVAETWWALGAWSRNSLSWNWVSGSPGHLPISRLGSCPATRVQQLRAVREADFQHPLVLSAMICFGGQDCCQGECRMWPAADPGWCPSRMRGWAALPLPPPHQPLMAHHTLNLVGTEA